LPPGEFIRRAHAQGLHGSGLTNTPGGIQGKLPQGRGGPGRFGPKKPPISQRTPRTSSGDRGRRKKGYQSSPRAAGKWLHRQNQGRLLARHNQSRQRPIHRLPMPCTAITATITTAAGGPYPGPLRPGAEDAQTRPCSARVAALFRLQPNGLRQPKILPPVDRRRNKTGAQSRPSQGGSLTAGQMGL